MKDEMSGTLIQEGYFLGIKQYGYWYLNQDGIRIEKSVIAGVKRDSIKFKDIKNIFEGEIITQTTNNSFFKNINKLEIQVKDISTSISFKPYKALDSNLKYLSPTIFKLDKLKLPTLLPLLFKSLIRIFKLYNNR
jgi:hypothetical protein